MKKVKRIPHFIDEDQERAFWATHDVTDYFDATHKIELDLSELQPSTKSVTIRLPEMFLADLKMLAHKTGCPLSITYEDFPGR